MLERAVSLAPANAGAWTNLGLALRDQSRAVDAINALQRGLALDPGHKAAKLSLAELYLAAGEVPRARQTADELVSGDPASPEGHYVRGQVLELQGDRAGAIREYRDFLDLATPALAFYAERVREHLDTLSRRTTP